LVKVLALEFQTTAEKIVLKTFWGYFFAVPDIVNILLMTTMMSLSQVAVCCEFSFGTAV